MSTQLNLGIIGLDTSHVEVFAGMLNDPEHAHHIEGARITIGYPGGSPDFEKSISRVDGYTKKLAEDYGVKMVDSPEAVAEACDAVLLTSVDGRVHLEQFSKIASYQRPTFIDKPFTITSDHARKIADVAKEHGTPIMTASGLRFAENLTGALADESGGAIMGADFIGPMQIEPTQTWYFWYGVHTVEALFATMGTGCVEVRATGSESHDMAVGLWSDGRIGSVRGFRAENRYFRGVLHRENRDEHLDLDAGTHPKHYHLMQNILSLFRSGESPVPVDQSVEIVRFLEAANASRESGECVKL